MNRNKSIFYVSVLLTFLIAAPVNAGSFVNLSGVYRCDDGGTYYIRTVGSEIFWYGKGNGWANVFHGTFVGQNRYKGKWADVPTGGARNSGSLTIQRRPNPKTLFRVARKGPFAGKTWTKIR